MIRMGNKSPGKQRGFTCGRCHLIVSLQLDEVKCRKECMGFTSLRMINKNLEGSSQSTCRGKTYHPLPVEDASLAKAVQGQL